MYPFHLPSDLYNFATFHQFTLFPQINSTSFSVFGIVSDCTCFGTTVVLILVIECSTSTYTLHTQQTRNFRRCGSKGIPTAHFVLRFVIDFQKKAAQKRAHVHCLWRRRSHKLFKHKKVAKKEEKTPTRPTQKNKHQGPLTHYRQSE